MKRILVSLAVVASLAAIPVSNALVKAHVPIDKAQVCHKGNVITVSRTSRSSHIAHADCGLPACDFANTFFTGDPCSGTAVGPGNVCSGLNPPNISRKCVAKRKRGG